MSEQETSVGMILGGILGGAIVLAGVVFWVHACVVADDATLGREEATVQRRNFEESASYRAGLRRDFDELMLSYAKARSDDERSAVLSVLRHRVEGAPPDAVPQDVVDFLKKNGGSK